MLFVIKIDAIIYEIYIRLVVLFFWFDRNFTYCLIHAHKRPHFINLKSNLLIGLIFMVVIFLLASHFIDFLYKCTSRKVHD